MAKKKKKIPVDSEGPPLPDDRFAALASLKNDLEAPLPQGPPPSKSPQKSAPWTVGKTRKGKYDIRLEKRSGGKTVTIVDRVSGNCKELLKVLRKVCACGGAIKNGAIEIQGDHKEKIIAFLNTSCFCYPDIGV